MSNTTNLSQMCVVKALGMAPDGTSCFKIITNLLTLEVR